MVKQQCLFGTLLSIKVPGRHFLFTRATSQSPCLHETLATAAITRETCRKNIITAGMADPFCDWPGSEDDSTDLCGCQRDTWAYIHFVDYSDCILLP